MDPIHHSAFGVGDGRSRRGAEGLEAFGSGDLVERVDELAALWGPSIASWLVRRRFGTRG